jgi:1,4-dihydroxy-2-naphthoyl-CoA hydrolase
MQTDDPAFFNARTAGTLPGYLGIAISAILEGRVHAELHLREIHLAPNGYLHAATSIALADTSAGVGCMNNLPTGCIGFTTIEVKSNHIGTAREGTIVCVAAVVHEGRSTQVWDAIVSHRQSNKTIALFRCTQMLLY